MLIQLILIQGLQMIKAGDSFIDNLILVNNKYFRTKVRASGQQRVKRHSLYFSICSGMFALVYYGMTIQWGYMFKQTARAVVHKGAIGLAYFYFYQMIWGWLHKQKSRQAAKKQLQIRSWNTYMFTSFLIFPVLVGVNCIYGHRTRVLLKRSMVDGLALAVFGMLMDWRINRIRNMLKNKKDLKEINKYYL